MCAERERSEARAVQNDQDSDQKDYLQGEAEKGEDGHRVTLDSRTQEEH